MRIEKIGSRPGRGERVTLALDDGSEISLPYEVVLRAGVQRGDDLSEARLAELLTADEAWRAREAALNLLSFRARSRAELAQRLSRKGFPAPVVEECLEELRERGLLDDGAFAESFVRDRVRGKPRGTRALTQELRGKGVPPEHARAAISSVMEGEGLSETDLARQAVARWRPRPGEEPERARRRLYGFLARRGFDAETALRVIEERGL